MSFKCEHCDKIIFKDMHRVITKKRDKIYNQEIVKYVKGEKTTQTKETKGWEIVEEIGICKKCNEEIMKPKMNEVVIGQQN